MPPDFVLLIFFSTQLVSCFGFRSIRVHFLAGTGRGFGELTRMENSTSESVAKLPAAPSLEPLAPEPLTLEAIYDDKIFEATTLRQPHWMRDSRHFSYLGAAPQAATTVVWINDVETNRRTPLFDPAILTLTDFADLDSASVPDPDTNFMQTDAETKPNTVPDDKQNVYAIQGYLWSPDETRILFTRQQAKRQNHSDSALYLYTLATNRLKRVTQQEGAYRNAKWSPDGSQIGYVRDDDLYLLDLATQSETRLTHSPSSTIYNGRFGWVYEEELGLTDGWAWSPDGSRIAFYQIDETCVPVVNLPNYDDLHQIPVEIRYPKAGDPNPIVRIGLIALNAPGFTKWVDLGPEGDIYLSRMQWTPDGELVMQRTPRLQNRVDVLKVDLETGETTTLFTETDDCWIETQGDITFIAGTNEFLWLSERDGWRHIYLYDLNGKLIRQITQGAWETARILGVDTKQRVVYFTARRPAPCEEQFYSVSLDGGDPVALTETPGTHQCLLAPDAQRFLDTHFSRAVAPHVEVVHITEKRVTPILDNPMPKLKNRRLGTWEFVSLPTSDGETLAAAILKPADFDPDRIYPVVMYTYGGPASQVATNSWGGGQGWEQYLAQNGYLVVMADGRGSGGRGRDFKKVTYQRLGYWETHDQIEAAKWLGGLPYVDANRIGIWGWSYGGYMASLCILKGADVFKAAMAVAPVTDWTLYDSIYTERYMRRPQDNPDGYRDGSPVTYADQLKGKFLLLHGTDDDNVHFQNAARLASELQKRNKPFQTMFYPGKRHGLEGVSKHVFTLLADFVLQNL